MPQMILTGRYVSPFVRRTAVTLTLYGIAFENKPLSTADHMADIKAVTPVGRVPALVLPDGDTLVDSSAIIDWADEQAGPAKRLTPASGPERRRALQLISYATTSMDKMVALAYERGRRPAEKVHEPWVEHLVSQFTGGLKWLDSQKQSPWLMGEKMSQADISAAIAYSFGALTHKAYVDAAKFPNLARLSERCEALPAFQAAKP